MKKAEPKPIMIPVHFGEDDVRQIENFRRRQRIIPSRSATIRHLVIKGLESEQKRMTQREENEHVRR